MVDQNEGTETSTLESELAAAFDGATPSNAGSTTESSAPDTPASADPNAAQSLLDAPKHWSEVDRTLFVKAPREVQQRWIDREAETARGLDAKFQEIAGFRKERDQYEEMLKPYKNELDMQGLSPAQFFKSLIGWQQSLQQSPRDGILRLAQVYGLSPQQLLEQQAQTDPQFAKINEELNQVKSQFSQLQTASEQRERQANLSKIQQFAESKDEGGKVAHPYFDEVSTDIISLMRTNPGLSLESAYTKAVRMNDQVWEKSQAEKLADKAKQDDMQRMASVDKAKKAAVSNSSIGAKGSQKEQTLEEQLEAGFSHYN